jgi:hypothetical protein
MGFKPRPLARIIEAKWDEIHRGAPITEAMLAHAH